MTKLDQNLECKGDGTDKYGRIGLDSPARVTRDMALELMAHHLMLAHLYYQATPHNEQVNRDELTRLLTDPSMPAGYVGPELDGALAWFDRMNRIYADMKREQDAEDEYLG